jgi:hypothetical protein
MVDTGIDHISITRRLEIEPTALDAVLARLRIENGSATARWRLGDRGTCEFDIMFVPAEIGGALDSTALLWAPDRAAFTTIAVTIVPCDGEIEIGLFPTGPLADWWTNRLAAYLDLAHAALEELAQELLWQYSRVAHERAS